MAARDAGAAAGTSDSLHVRGSDNAGHLAAALRRGLRDGGFIDSKDVGVNTAGHPGIAICFRVWQKNLFVGMSVGYVATVLAAEAALHDPALELIDNSFP